MKRAIDFAIWVWVGYLLARAWLGARDPRVEYLRGLGDGMKIGAARW